MVARRRQTDRLLAAEATMAASSTGKLHVAAPLLGAGQRRCRRARPVTRSQRSSAAAWRNDVQLRDKRATGLEDLGVIVCCRGVSVGGQYIHFRYRIVAECWTQINWGQGDCMRDCEPIGRTDVPSSSS